MGGRAILGLALVLAALIGGLVWLMDDGLESGGDAVTVLSGSDVAQRPGEGDGPAAAAPGAASRLTAADGPPPAANSAAASAADTPPRPRVTLSGQLVTPEGRPVPDARVALLTGPGAQLQTLALTRADGDPAAELGIGHDTSDAEGRFAIDVELPEVEDDAPVLPAFLDGLADAGTRVLVRHPGYRTEEHGVPPLVEGRVDAGVLVLAPAATLVGRVLGPDRQPVSGARLAVRRGEQGQSGLAGIFDRMLGTVDDALSRSRSADDGTFVLTGLEPGVVGLLVASADSPPLLVPDLLLEAGLSRDVGDLHLQAGLTLAGVVVDGEGQPLEGVVVRAHPSTSGLDAVSGAVTRVALGGLDPQDTTNVEGRFLLRGLSDVPHRIRTGGEGFSRAELDDVRPGRDGLLLTVHPLGELWVRVRSALDAAVLADASVSARALPEDREATVLSGEALERRARSGQLAELAGDPLPDVLEGGHLVLGAGRGGTRLVVEAPGHALALVEAPGLLRRLRRELWVELVPESALAGVVVDDRGEPVAGARVEARPAGDRETTRSSGGGAGLSFTTEHTLATGGVPSALAEAGVAAEVRARTDEDGRFRLGGLSAGRWVVEASSRDLLPGEPQEHELAAEQLLEGLRFVLQPGGTLVGTVREADGRPAAGLRVNVEPRAPTQAAAGSPADAVADQLGRNLMRSLGVPVGEGRQARTDEQGHYRLAAVPPGVYVVSLLEEGPPRVQLDLGALLGGGAPVQDEPGGRVVELGARQTTTVDFVREPRASLEVTVLAAGRPEPGARVSLAPTPAGPLAIDLGLGGSVLRADDRGRVLFDDLQPGRYDVRAAVDGSPRLESVSVEVLQGEPARVDVAFGGGFLEGRVVDARSGRPVAGVEVTVAEHVEGGGADTGGGGFLSGLFSSGSFSVTTSVTQEDGSQVTTSSSGGRTGGLSLGLTADTLRTDADGRFRLSFLSPGRWVVTAGGGAWLPTTSDPVTVGDGDLPRELELTVQRGATLSGMLLRGTTEDPLDDVRIELEPVDGGEFETRTRSRDGRYRIEGVPAGRYALVIGPGGNRGRREVSVSEDGRDLTVHLVTID